MKIMKYQINNKKFIKIELTNPSECECAKWLNKNFYSDRYKQRKNIKIIISLEVLKEKGYEPISEENIIMKIKQEEQNRALYNAINQLPVKQKKVIIMRFFKNYNLSDIASYYGVTIQAVHKILIQALNKLKKNLQGSSLFN